MISINTNERVQSKIVGSWQEAWTVSATEISHFDETIHKTNTWLKEIMMAFEWDDRQTAYRALRVTLHSLRDHLPIEIVAHFSAQLPTLIRGIFFDGWKPSKAAKASRSLGDFLHPIHKAFDRDIYPDAELIAQRVFSVIASHVSDGEIEHIEQALPKHVRESILKR